MRMTVKLVGVVIAVGLGVSTLVAAAPASAQSAAAPQCPAGSTFNPATGACETSVCPPGSTFFGGFCTTGPVPLAGCTPPAVPVPGPGGALVCGTPAPGCAAGFTGPSATGVCSVPPSFLCPPGATLSGTVCQAPAAFPLGSTNVGPAVANGGNGGDASGGDGGRGGAGFAPECSQNTNGDGDDAVVDCGAGGSGGDGGDGGTSSGGEGGDAIEIPV